MCKAVKMNRYWGMLAYLGMYIMLSSFVMAEDETVTTNVTQVWSMHGKSALLNCKIPSGMRAPVMWLHPHTGIAISINHRVMVPQLADRIVIVGDKTQREHNLMIKYIKFPEDAGLWKCVTLGMIQLTNLSVIVPPIEEIPMVNPTIMTDMKHEAWTFTCSSQFAIPPVNLSWVKVSGPDMQYDVILPNYVVSSQHQVAVTLRLIVTPLNFGSVFICIAQHPSYNEVKNNTVVYAPPMSQVKDAASSQKSSFSHKDIMSMVQKSKLSQPNMKIGIHEKASIVLIISLIAIVLCAGCLMYNTRKKWQCNDINLESKKNIIKNRCKFCTGAILWLFFSLIQILSIGLSFPAYMKGITIPLLGTDMLMSVSAGSALWMDCGSKVEPIESLLQITWQYNFQTFFRQYIVNKQNIGFPNNSTLGYMVGSRTKSYRVGQISVWPILPGEDGIYSCQVAGLEDNSGKTRIKRKTFGVFVVTGPYLNKPLLLLLIVAAISSIMTFVTISCHMVKRRTNKAETATERPSLRRVLERPLMMGSVT